ncbi:hypothetical protein M405DRAFT_195701 [Rhizopogon salebrosus TDB-379]|nr:hypothetical protein M405DRAFT_195701 [Rhizopogon salebrosus TDB-379]
MFADELKAFRRLGFRHCSDASVTPVIVGLSSSCSKSSTSPPSWRPASCYGKASGCS